MLLMMNNDQPGVIGAVGTILGRHDVNIANFALGRNDNGAVGVVNVDDPGRTTCCRREVIEEIRAGAGDQSRRGPCGCDRPLRRSFNWSLMTNSRA